VPDTAAPQVVVLAGGLGTRLRRLTGDLPKALVPVRGEPFAHHQLRLLAAQGVDDVLYVIGHQGDRIRAAVGDGSAFGMSVDYVDEGTDLHGTAGALRFALDEGALAEVFAVLYGDSYLPIDLGPVWAAFEASSRPALMTVLRNDDRWDRSNVVFEESVVTRYDKRPEKRDPRSAWIDYGLSVLRREVVEEIPSGTVVDLADVYRELSERGELGGYEVSSRFYEVGTPEGVADLERHLARS
jgi:N-acetyl-alpha-D-muramate 1-phosphate uridylyltransferase